MKIKVIKKSIILILAFCLVVYPHFTYAASDNSFPRLANYYLKWDINDDEAEEIAKWDLAILDMENQFNCPEKLRKIRELNPNITILAYITTQEIRSDLNSYPNASLRKKLNGQINDSWWLRDASGQKVTYWPGTNMLNLSDDAGSDSSGKKWNQKLPEFVKSEILSTGLWDGVFYDNIWPDVAWANGNLDVNNDGKKDADIYVNQKWNEGTKKMLEYSRRLFGGDTIIVGNGRIDYGYQSYLNGMMFESFPSSWEGNSNWAYSMDKYINLKTYNVSPSTELINSYNKNQFDYQKMRFGLASSLLDNGYYSYDYDVSSHGQLWWYDEYDVNLGTAQSSPYNLLDKNNSTIKAGLWRRDFENGVAIVNSTVSTQSYVFKEEFEKINGSQDETVNNGEKINWLKIKPNDGIILLKTNTEVINAAFNNGSFVRIFDVIGNQTRNGFFAYKEIFPGGTQVLVSDIDNDGRNETLVNGKGEISIYKDGKIIMRFKPYEGRFTGKISFTVEDLNGDGTKEIITGAGVGGGPHVRIFSKEGRMLTGGFFAYDKNFRGGVNIAAVDLNGDGTKEIITGAGPGGGPHVRIFSKDGKPLGGFFAYDKNFKGGVSVAVGDVTGDSKKEIITGAGPGGGPQVKVFDVNAKQLNSFFAYGSDVRTGITVMTSNVDKAGYDEVLVGTVSF
jgi:hypothetical protein